MRKLEADNLYRIQYRNAELARARNKQEERRLQASMRSKHGLLALEKFHLDAVDKERRLLERELERIRSGIHGQVHPGRDVGSFGARVPQATSRRSSLLAAEGGRRKSMAGNAESRRTSVVAPPAGRKQSLAIDDARQGLMIGPVGETRRKSIAETTADVIPEAGSPQRDRRGIFVDDLEAQGSRSRRRSSGIPDSEIIRAIMQAQWELRQAGSSLSDLVELQSEEDILKALKGRAGNDAASILTVPLTHRSEPSRPSFETLSMREETRSLDQGYSGADSVFDADAKAFIPKSILKTGQAARRRGSSSSGEIEAARARGRRRTRFDLSSVADVDMLSLKSDIARRLVGGEAEGKTDRAMGASGGAVGAGAWRAGESPVFRRHGSRDSRDSSPALTLPSNASPCSARRTSVTPRQGQGHEPSPPHVPAFSPDPKPRQGQRRGSLKGQGQSPRRSLGEEDALSSRPAQGPGTNPRLPLLRLESPSTVSPSMRGQDSNESSPSPFRSPDISQRSKMTPSPGAKPATGGRRASKDVTLPSIAAPSKVNPRGKAAPQGQGKGRGTSNKWSNIKRKVDIVTKPAVKKSKEVKAEEIRAKEETLKADLDREHYNPDGSLRKVHQLPDLDEALEEARTARYLRQELQFR